MPTHFSLVALPRQCPHQNTTYCVDSAKALFKIMTFYTEKFQNDIVKGKASSNSTIDPVRNCQNSKIMSLSMEKSRRWLKMMGSYLLQHLRDLLGP